ncbi:pyroglutamylated RF-amide peptide receptor-like [Trachemys scripta elegans]|uniref:pyroglutamylated RF-amide peptide receptor-like n=1 Tax=Trachemys scripta elegans TaxID=31138 RepID=UPI001558159D|nr:pyroglutamylated RF-amide peptide receptor-like [Trachemys scripta elegans]
MERRLNVTPEALNRLLEEHNMTREEFIAAYGLKPLVYIPELPPSAKVVFLVIYIIIFALALLGNSLVVYIIIRRKAMRTATNIFICSLACSDLLVTFFCIPFTLLQNVSSEWLGAETLSAGASSKPGQRLSQIRRCKKKTQEDMFNELMCTSESDKTELSAWRIALSDNLHNDHMDRRPCREHRLKIDN